MGVSDVAALEARVARLEAENAELHKRAGGAGTEDVSRRALLRRLGAAAAAGAGLATVGGALRERAASAHDVQDVLLNGSNTSTATTTLAGTVSGDVLDLTNHATGKTTLYAIAGASANVPSPVAAAVVGDSNQSAVAGVGGRTVSGVGVHGEASGSGVGVFGGGVESSVGVLGSAGIGVAGRSGDGIGVQATSDTGIGFDSTAPIAARLSGSLLLLTPVDADGNPIAIPPTSGSHFAGEVAADENGALFVCTVAGSPGTWVRIAYGGGFTPVAPVRICDTRVGHGPGGTENNPYNVYATGPIAPFSDLTIKVSGLIGPSGGQAQFVPTNATAVVFNLAVTGFSHAGNFTCYPADTGVPNAANLNWPEPPTEIAALSNLVSVKLGAITGDAAHTGIKIHNASSGSAQAIVDLAGFYA